jgi:hypothetical protein
MPRVRGSCLVRAMDASKIRREEERAELGMDVCLPGAGKEEGDIRARRIPTP